jgi:DNA-binding transcriptional ArsR family regulator
MPRASADLAPAEFLQLVADRQRWELLTALAKGDRRVTELTELLGKPQNLVSYHLGVLRRGGLVTARRSSADGRDMYYRADLVRVTELLGATGVAIHPGLRLVPAASGRPTAHSRRAPLVLFLCTGNSARSQMAEAMVEQRSGGTVRARSAGSHPKPLHPSAVQVMAERGIDIKDRSPKHLRRFARSHFDRVITLCDKVREVCPEFPHGGPVRRGRRGPRHLSRLLPHRRGARSSDRPPRRGARRPNDTTEGTCPMTRRSTSAI